MPNLPCGGLPNSGDVKLTAISQSNKHLAFVSGSAQGVASLSVSELRDGGFRVVLHDDGIDLNDIAFSPDDTCLYYRSFRKGNREELSWEYRVPVLGGEPTMVITDVDGPAHSLAAERDSASGKVTPTSLRRSFSRCRYREGREDTCQWGTPVPNRCGLFACRAESRHLLRSRRYQRSGFQDRLTA